MSKRRRTQVALIAGGILAVVIVLGLVTGTLPALWNSVQRLWTGSAAAGETPIPAGAKSAGAAELFRDARGNLGLRLTPTAVKGLQPDPAEAKRPTQPRALPPQIGTVQYDLDRLFNIRSRFGGEVAEVREFVDTDTVTLSSAKVTRMRPMRFGDKIKQGDLLAVVWSQQLGTAKAALVDAISNLALSQDMLDRQAKMFEKGEFSLGTYKLTERQVRLDTNAQLTAERSLRMWKLNDEEIQKIKDEAKVIIDQKKVRSAAEETKWARVEIRAPIFCWDADDPKKPDPNVQLTVVEKNTHLNDMLDPIASPVLFKLADMSRLQVWVQPPEEYLPLLQEKLKNGKLRWKIQFQADPNADPLDLEIVQVGKSLDPNLRTALVMGYLPNKDDRFLVGQFVTATIFVDPEPDTVEIPTNALNEVEGESLVFVQTDANKNEYVLRRVSVVQRFKDVTIVRSKLTKRDREVSEVEVEKGRRPIETLLPGERVVTRSLVELTAELERLAAKDRVERDQKGQ